MYKNIITLGFNCAIARSCRKYGLRSRAYPFDWIVTSLKGIIDCIEENFCGFMKEEWIVEVAKGTYYHYYHTRYDYCSPHDFDDGIWNDIDFKGQFEYVKTKYEKRIHNFVEDYRAGNALMIRQIKDLEEAEYIASDLEHIKDVLLINEQGAGNHMIWIGEKPVVEYLKEKNIPVYEAEIDWTDGSTGRLLDRNAALKNMLLSGQIDSEIQVKNLLYVQSLYNERIHRNMTEMRIKDKLLDVMAVSTYRDILKNNLNGRKFVIYGAGGLGWTLGGALYAMGLYPVYYLDKFKKKAGMSLWEKNVITLKQAEEYEKPEKLIIAIPYEGEALESVKSLLGRFFSCEIEDMESMLDRIK